VAPNVANRIESAGVSVHLHKLIYKFQDDLENLVHDMKQKEELARGGGLNIEVLGEAHILQIFEVTDKGNKKLAKR
jgi:translation initiation factor IF-2